MMTSLLIVSLFVKIVSGYIAASEVWDLLQEPQVQCANGQSLFYQGYIQHYYHCILAKTASCIEDMADYKQQSSITLRYFCACISSERIVEKMSWTRWQIHSSHNVRLHVEKFSLIHIDWKCTEERMEISSSNGMEELCGSRLPWKQDLPGPDISITFHTVEEYSEASFLLFYHRISKWRRVMNVVRYHLMWDDMSMAYYYPNFEANDDVFIHYASGVKLHYISLNVFQRVAQITVICYDGPGSKSPVLKNKDAIQSENEPYFVAGTYQMYCTFSKRQNYSIQYEIYSVASYVFLTDDRFSSSDDELSVEDTYKSIPFTMTSEHEAAFSLQFDSSLQKGNHLYKLEVNRRSLFKEYFHSSVKNELHTEIQTMFNLELTLRVFAGFLPHMKWVSSKKSRAECLYGGLYVLSHRDYQLIQSYVFSANDVNEQQLWYQCTPTTNTDIPIYLDGGITRIIVIAYEGYLDGPVDVKGTIKIKENFRVLSLNVPVTLRIYLRRGMEMSTTMDLTEQKNVHFVVQPFTYGYSLDYNFRYKFEQNGLLEYTSEAILITFEYYGNCTYCYVECAPHVSHYIDVPVGKKIVKAVSSASKKYGGSIESNVEALTVDQSNCKSPQKWTLFFKYLSNYDIWNAWNAYENRTYLLTLTDEPQTIWSYSQYSDKPTSFLLKLLRPVYSTSSSIWTVKFDTMCLTTDIFLERLINNTDDSNVSYIYILYKWQNTSEALWLSGCDNCNIILQSDPARISASCDKTRKYVDRTIVTRYKTAAESFIGQNNTLKWRTFTSYGIR